MERAAAHIARGVVPQPDGWEAFAHLGVPALLIDRAAHVIRANIAAEELFGASEAALRHRALPEPFPTLARHEAGARAHDLEIDTASGRVRADVALAPLGHRSGWLTAAVLPRPEAAPASAAAAGVAATLAHEIKNPLAGIRGAAQLLGEGGDAENAELAALICSEVDRIARLVGRLEGLADEPFARPEPVNLNELMHHVARLSGGGRVRVREDYDPSLPPVEGNRDQLVQLFLNLASNAREAVGDTGEITFATAYRYGARAHGRPLPIEARVEDSGPGVPASLADRLFQPFVSSKASGRGLGLALVAKIAADHGAALDHVRTGGRTVFRLRFATAA